MNVQSNNEELEILATISDIEDVSEHISDVIIIEPDNDPATEYVEQVIKDEIEVTIKNASKLDRFFYKYIQPYIVKYVTPLISENCEIIFFLLHLHFLYVSFQRYRSSTWSSFFSADEEEANKAHLRVISIIDIMGACLIGQMIRGYFIVNQIKFPAPILLPVVGAMVAAANIVINTINNKLSEFARKKQIFLIFTIGIQIIYSLIDLLISYLSSLLMLRIVLFGDSTVILIILETILREYSYVIDSIYDTLSWTETPIFCHYILKYLFEIEISQ